MGNKCLTRIRFDLVFVLLNLTLLIVHASLAIGKFEAFNLYGTDFALFDQVIWNTLHGRLLENTIIVDAPMLLAQRFSPILFAFVPLYALVSSSRILVLTPTVAIGIAALPLYWFARQRLGRPLALVIVLLFWTMPGLQPIVLGNFKEIILTIPFLMIVAGFGLCIFLVQRRYALGSALTVFGMVWTVVLIQVVIPYFHGGASYYYFGVGQYSASGLYEYLGTSVPEIVMTLVTRPAFVLAHVLTPEKIDTLAKIFLPYAALGILGAEHLLLTLPTLGYTLLSERYGQYIFGSEHYAPVYVFLVVAVVVGAERLLKFLPSARRDVARVALGAFIVTTSAATYFLHAPGPFSRNFVPQLYTPSPHDCLGAQIAEMIPQDAVVAVQSELASHVAQRRYLYLDAMVPCLSGVDYAFADTRRPWYSYREPVWQTIFQSGWFAPVSETDGYRLYRRLPTLQLDAPLNIQLGDSLMLLGFNLPRTKTLQGGEALRVLTGWSVTRSLTQSLVFQYSVYDHAGHLWVEVAREPCQGIYPTDQWSPGQVYYDDVALRLPPTMPSGDYTVSLAVYPHLQNALWGEVKMASVRVTKNKQSFTASDLWIEQRYYVDMGEMRLLGFKPIPATIHAGQTLPLGLYWRARAKPQGDYRVVVQLRDDAGRVVVEQSARPAQGTYPTMQWEAGEVLLDWHDLELPPDLAQGVYQIVVILREVAGERALGEARLSEIRVEQ